MKGLTIQRSSGGGELFERFGQLKNDGTWRWTTTGFCAPPGGSAGCIRRHCGDDVRRRISDVKAYEAFREVRDISIHYGCSRLFADLLRRTSSNSAFTWPSENDDSRDRREIATSGALEEESDAPTTTALVILTLVTGCPAAAEKAPHPLRTGRHRRHPEGTTHEFWKSIHAGAVKASREDDVEILWKGPLKEDDREAQISVVEDFINRGSRASSWRRWTTPRSAAGRGRRTGGDPRGHLRFRPQGRGLRQLRGHGQLQGGTLAGEHLDKLLSGKGKVAMLRYQEGSASTMEREQGFLDAIAKAPASRS